MMEGQQKKMDMPKWAKQVLTVISLALLVGIGTAILLHVVYQDDYPSPKSIEAGLLISIAVVTIFATYFPWTKLSFGGVEIERIIEEHAGDYAQEIARLETLLAEKTDALSGEATTKQIDEVQAGGFESRRPTAPARLDVAEQTETLLMNFLSEWPSWGFTPLRIKNWGSTQPGFEGLGKLNLGRIRIGLTKLSAQGKVQMQISKSGNALYQKA